MANPSVVCIVWLWITLVIAFYDKRRLQANAQANRQDPSQQLQVCHEDHGRCIRDATYQNCSESSLAPTISHKVLVNITVHVNTAARFKCMQETLSGSFVSPQFDWVKWNPDHDSALDIDHGKFTIIDMDSKYTITPAAEGHHHISYLTIHNVTMNDSGLYSCVVCNQYGRDYRTVFLSLEMTPVLSTMKVPLLEASTSVASKPGKHETRAASTRVFSTTKVPFLESSTHAASTPVFSTKFPLVAPSTRAASSGVSQQTVIILGSLGAMAGLIVIAFMIYFAWKKRGGGKMQQNLPMILQESNLLIEAEDNIAPSPKNMVLNGQVAIVRKRNSSYRSQLSSVASAGTIITYTDAEFEYPLDEKWEVPRGSIAIKELAGEGAFGYVAKAEAFDLPNMPSPCTVAVKMLKETASDVELSDLISEMETMKEIGTHKNIVNFLGACTIQGPLLLIVEFCPYGNLRDFLRSNRPSLIDDKKAQLLTFRDLLSIAYQITRGMSYLSSKKCIHRDLAARNVLIAEDFVIKIADFGLSRNLGSTEYYRKTSDGRLPVKWLAIEALFDQQYTIKSDVWSFGILLWEIFTLGGTPYPGIPVERLFTLLKNGYRMECPINCPPNIYETMLHCWSEHAKSRPSFAELYEKLDGFLSAETALEYVAVLAQSVDCLAETDTNEPQQTPDRSFPKTSTNKINTVV